MTRRAVAALAATLIVGLVFAGSLSSYSQYVGTTIVLYAVVAQGYNILAGYSGQLSLGVGAFLGVGGYAAGLLMLHVGTGWIPSLVAATAIGAAFAFVLGFALLRLRGVYFAVGTAAAAAALGAGAALWNYAGGGTGFVIVTVPSSLALFRAAVVAFVIATGVVVFIRDSPFGLRMVATRDNERAAAGVGVSVFWYRMAALVISGALTSLAGALIALQTLTVSPDAVFSLSWTVSATLFVVVGGRATVMGPIIGVLIVYYGLTERLQSLQSLSTLIEGVLLIVVMRFAPGGVWPILVGLMRRLKRMGRTGLSVGIGSTTSVATNEASAEAIALSEDAGRR